MVKAIVGANWGDEGKGKITDMLAEQSDVVIRFQGGANAGHTIINNYGRFALHILPSGTFYPHVTNIIGNGVALDIQKLVDELGSITSQGVPAPNLIVSERAQILMPYHRLQDSYEEERLGGKAFGSTKSGIAPFYSDKYAKIGIQVCDLFHEDRLRERLTAAVSLKNVLFEHLYHKPSLDVDELYQQLMELREQIRPYVGDAVTFVHDALRAGKTVLLEGQLGSMKDPDLGIFPLTTSSHTLAGFGCVGAAVPPTAVEDVICVTKAYSSSVGSNTEPFVSEVLGEAGDELRRRGGDKGEFGATTGRPRRVGWFDTVATKYGCMVQGATQVALTCLDVLGYLDEIPVCTGYEIDGTVTDRFPTPPELMRARPVFTTLPGWKCDIRGCTDYQALPQQAKAYVDFLTSTARDHIVTWSLGDWLDLNPDTTSQASNLTPVAQTSTAGYYWMSRRLAEYAEILGYDRRLSEHYGALAERIRERFNREFLDPRTGIYAENSQTAQALPLALGLVPDTLKAKVGQRLLDAIDLRDGHISAGFIGGNFTMDYLPRSGRFDVAYRMLTRLESPGWLHMVQSERSTMSESINQNGPGSGHHPYGAYIGFWLYKYLGGIRPDEAKPGFREFVIEPGLDSGLAEVSVGCRSLYGEIVSAWKRRDGGGTLTIRVPANTVAELILPAGAVGRNPRVNGVRLRDIPSIAPIPSSGDGKIRYSVGSGTYEFELR